MRVLAGVRPGTSCGAVLRSALDQIVPVDVCDESHLALQLTTHAYSATIVEVRPHAPEITVTVVRSLRNEHPVLPIVLYSQPDVFEPDHWLALGHERISHVFVAGRNDGRQEIRSAILGAASEDLPSRVLNRLGDNVPIEVRALLRFALANAQRRVHVTDMAQALNLHRRTLSARSRNVRYPSPSALIAWARLLIATDIMMSMAATADRAAVMAGFGSGTAFRNMLRRYTGLRPAEVRAGGGLEYIIALLRESIKRDGRNPLRTERLNGRTERMSRA
jgi:AraC-like DNA-binding protein